MELHGSLVITAAVVGRAEAAPAGETTVSCPNAWKVLNIWEPHLSFLIHRASIYFLELLARTKQESVCQRLQAQMPLGPIKSVESGRLESTAPFYLLID